MLSKVILKKNFLIGLSLVGMVTLSFQNCGQNMSVVDNPAGNTSLDSSDIANSLVPCIAGGCPQANEYIQISVENHDPVLFIVGASNQVLEGIVDISGFCNAGGFLLSRIYYSVADDSGTLAIPVSPSPGACNELGRYQLPIPISNLDGTKNYHITVILKAVDSTGTEYENPLGRNRKQIGLSPHTGT